VLSFFMEASVGLLNKTHGVEPRCSKIIDRFPKDLQAAEKQTAPAIKPGLLLT
jgi:hypothetical protein